MTQPRAPKYLDATARHTWKRLVGELPDLEAGTLMALEQLCYSWSRWLSAEDDDSRLRWSRCCRQWLAELKLTPKTKTAVRVATTEESGDPILRLIGNPE